jgi:hypothetical protein
MKKIVFTALTLMVLAGSTFTISTVHAGDGTPAKPSTKSAQIPPPSCPIDDPRGCGIFG